MTWSPSIVLRVIKTIPSSTSPVLVDTDAGLGYLKALGNPEGPHALACDFVGTELASWLGLSTFDYSLISLTTEDELPITNGLAIVPSTAFITRSEQGDKWGGSSDQLKLLSNPEEIARLVAFDTWTLNCDRHSTYSSGDLLRTRQKADNVFLSTESGEAGKLELRTMDHTCCFTCGRPLSKEVSRIDRIRDERVFGLFPAFRPFIERDAVKTAIIDLRRFERSIADSVLARVPADWELDAGTRAALAELITRRAEYVAETLEGKLFPQGDLPCIDEVED